MFRWQRVVFACLGQHTIHTHAPGPLMTRRWLSNAQTLNTNASASVPFPAPPIITPTSAATGLAPIRQPIRPLPFKPLWAVLGPWFYRLIRDPYRALDEFKEVSNHASGFDKVKELELRHHQKKADLTLKSKQLNDLQERLQMEERRAKVVKDEVGRLRDSAYLRQPSQEESERLKVLVAQENELLDVNGPLRSLQDKLTKCQEELQVLQQDYMESMNVHFKGFLEWSENLRWFSFVSYIILIGWNIIIALVVWWNGTGAVKSEIKSVKESIQQLQSGISKQLEETHVILQLQQSASPVSAAVPPVESTPQTRPIEETLVNVYHLPPAATSRDVNEHVLKVLSYLPDSVSRSLLEYVYIDSRRDFLIGMCSGAAMLGLGVLVLQK